MAYKNTIFLIGFYKFPYIIYPKNLFYNIEFLEIVHYQPQDTVVRYAMRIHNIS